MNLFLFFAWMLCTEGFRSSLTRATTRSRQANILMASSEGPLRFLRGSWSKWFPSAPKAAPATQQPATVINKEVVIIGAGVAGLICARELVRKGITDLVILEASDDVGGRIRTDRVDGFLLDRGFQVFIDQYPLAKQQFDYAALDLCAFQPGALVRFNRQFYTVSDPFRRPQDIVASLVSPIGSLIDKVTVGVYSLLIQTRALEDIFSAKETDTLTHMRALGLSDSMIDRFFTPFFQGIFLAPLAAQSSRMFEFVFKMFTEGSATLPRRGMGALMTQIKDDLPADSVVLNCRVERIKEGNVFTPRGVYKGRHTVIATEAPVARRLLNETPLEEFVSVPPARKSTCLYFGLDGAPPVDKPVLILNGENKLPASAFEPRGVKDMADVAINNVCFPSQVSSAYAPVGKSLASVTVVGDVEGLSDSQLEQAVRGQLLDWWGDATKDWSLLRIYKIPYAQPAQTVPYTIRGKDPRIGERIFCCGDHRGSATLNGAIDSGLRTAATVAAR